MINTYLSEHVRLTLQRDNSGGGLAGFVTVTTWTAEEEKPISTNSSPSHVDHLCEERSSHDDRRNKQDHQPSALDQRLNLEILFTWLFKNNFRHPFFHKFHSQQSFQSYRFSTRLGGDIFMLEMMAEPKIGFSFPKQLLWVLISCHKRYEMFRIFSEPSG